jgi:CRP-like cAMP-binding protein
MLKKSAHEASVVSYYPEDTVFKEGWDGSTAFIIKSGEIELSIFKDGLRVVFETLKEGDCFGEMAPLYGNKRSATATANVFTELYVVDQNNQAAR